MLPEQFRAELRAQGTQYYDTHPFHLRMHAGELSPEEIRSWVANRFYYQKMIPIKDAAFLANCPDREVRRAWIQRVLDHDGRGGDPGGIEKWLQLGEAVGVSRAELEEDRRLIPAVRFAVDAYVNFVRHRPWLEGAAASLTEMFAPKLMAKRIAVFEQHYPWIDAQGLQYFRNRLHQAPRDAEFALEFVVERSTTRAEQDAAVAALRFKCDVLWAMLDAIDYHSRRDGGGPSGQGGGKR
ncbi:MAG: pyrroloquinoline-quinone synthase PqqC [Gemmatimonadota bacterium]